MFSEKSLVQLIIHCNIKNFCGTFELEINLKE